MTDEEATREINTYKQERNEALLSLDESKIRAMVKKWNGTEMPQGEVFWGAVHKAITGVGSLPVEFRKKSKAWLEGRGLKSLNDGDL